MFNTVLFNPARSTVPGLGHSTEEVERLFSEFFGVAPRGLWGEAAPALNLWEDDSNLYVETELPGYKLGELEIVVQKNELSLKGERKTEEIKDVRFHRRERGMASFARVIRLPAEVESDKVQAALRDGVLTITLPKAEEAKPRKIQVHVK